MHLKRAPMTMPHDLPPLLQVLAVFLFGGAWLLFGWELSGRFGTWEGERWQRAAAATVLAHVGCLAWSWLLALTGLLTVVPLWLGTLAAGGWVVRRVAPRWSSLRAGAEVQVQHSAVLLVGAIPAVVWVVYLAWRAWLLPPMHHDALSHHLPRAIILFQQHGFNYIPSDIFPISYFPCNYELLLADIILVTGSDALTEFVSILQYVGFVVVAGALSERWWGEGLHNNAAAMAAGMTPVVMLHAGVHKTDLMTSLFFVQAMLWLGRWTSERTWPGVLLGGMAGAIALGTKAHAGLLLFALLPTAWRWWYGTRRTGRRTPTAAQGLGFAVFAAGAVSLLGGVPYLVNMVRTGSPVGRAGPEGATLGYGDFENLLYYPRLLLTAPFSESSLEVWDPLIGEAWYWPRYEVYYAHFGWLMSLLILLLPLGLARYARARDGTTETMVSVAGALVAALLVIPNRARPLGFWAAFTRYIMFIVPFVVAGALSPLLRDGLRRQARWATAAPVALALAFAHNVYDYGRNDAFQPWSLVLKSYASDARPLRAVRAAHIVDARAALDDTVAVDGLVDAWIYPLFGANMSRHVVLLQPRDGRVTIPESARWVVIDRSWNIAWGHPDFLRSTQWREYLGRGHPLEGDEVVLRQLAQDPAWELVYIDRHFGQAVLKRNAPGGADATPPAVPRTAAQADGRSAP